MKQVSIKQITEWIENPVTIAFKKTCQLQRDAVIDDGGLNAYTEYKPQRTQEYLARLSGKGEVWEEIIETLDGEGLWELDEELEDDDE